MLEKKTDEKGDVLFVKSKPIVTVNDMLNGLLYLKSTELSENVRLLEDARGSKIDFDVSSIDVLINGIEETSKIFKTIRHAVIHDNAINTAIAVLINESKKANNYTIKVFSTEESALIWLNSPVN